MKRMVAIVFLLGGALTLLARPANPLAVGADMALGIYQKLISPLQGGHICNFSPTCSHFSRRSYRLYGPFWGTLMTFDRLQRCNPGAWRQLNVYYSHIENERLADPPDNHYLPLKIKKSRRVNTATDSCTHNKGEEQ